MTHIRFDRSVYQFIKKSSSQKLFKKTISMENKFDEQKTVNENKDLTFSTFPRKSILSPKSKKGHKFFQISKEIAHRKSIRAYLPKLINIDSKGTTLDKSSIKMDSPKSFLLKTPCKSNTLDKFLFTYSQLSFSFSDRNFTKKLIDSPIKIIKSEEEKNELSNGCKTISLRNFAKRKNKSIPLKNIKSNNIMSKIDPHTIINPIYKYYQKVKSIKENNPEKIKTNDNSNDIGINKRLPTRLKLNSENISNLNSPKSPSIISNLNSPKEHLNKFQDDSIYFQNIHYTLHNLPFQELKKIATESKPETITKSLKSRKDILLDKIEEMQKLKLSVEEVF